MNKYHERKRSMPGAGGRSTNLTKLRTIDSEFGKGDDVALVHVDGSIYHVTSIA